MKQMVIDTGNTSGLAAFGLFEREGFQPGDTLRIVRRPDLSQEARVALVLLVMIAANYFLRKKPTGGKPPAADDLMSAVAATDKGVADLQADLKNEFGVQVEMGPDRDGDRAFWSQVGALGMASGYAEDEPDISRITLLEPNPLYKPWKKGT
jgi:hypothetical protein